MTDDTDNTNAIGDVRALAQIIVDTIREPLLVLNSDLEILLATASFGRHFGVNSKAIQGSNIFALEKNAWNIPDLRELLARTVSLQIATENLELVHDFPRIGPRTLLLNTRLVQYEDADRTTIFLSFDDVTERRRIEREREQLQQSTRELLRQKDILLSEMEHRVINSLQIIASILILKARAVSSEETRHHLQDAHRRVMSVAAVQQHLHAASQGDRIEVAPYIEKLCGSLSSSIIADDPNTRLEVITDEGSATSRVAVSIGLIITELVINALKHGFPNGRDTAVVTVRYEVNGTDWRLSIADNGLGMARDLGQPAKVGLGTSLVQALADQLDARIKTTSTAEGMTVVITHATFAGSQTPPVA